MPVREMPWKPRVYGRASFCPMSGVEKPRKACNGAGFFPPQQIASRDSHPAVRFRAVNKAERRRDAETHSRGSHGKCGVGARWRHGPGAGGRGLTTLGVTVEEQKSLVMGWSAKKRLLGEAVYNSSGEKIGAVEDSIITPEKAVSYAIVGTGGFLGIDRHDVAIPVGQLKLQGDKLMLPGATKEGLKALPKFEYAK